MTCTGQMSLILSALMEVLKILIMHRFRTYWQIPPTEQIKTDTLIQVSAGSTYILPVKKPLVTSRSLLLSYDSIRQEYL